MSFESLGIAKWLVEALNAMAINKPTEIQRRCIPPILEGRNCIGGAKTGSGKTIAFAAPMLSEWSKDPFGICGLILTPSRELAIQIADQFAVLGTSMNVKISVVVGGMSMMNQCLELQNSPHFVVATPGRLADHIRNSGEDTIRGLHRCRYVVLDEADRLLQPSLAAQLEECLNVLPPREQRQTLLFTATVTEAVRYLKNSSFGKGNAETFLYEIPANATMLPEKMIQRYMLVPSYVKPAYLYAVISAFAEKSIIIFVNNTGFAEQLTRTLKILGVKVAGLHSQLSQKSRMEALELFSTRVARVLVATDVASRGLDIPLVSVVLNFDVPGSPDDYIHRAGRTARANQSGEVITLITERDIVRLRAIEDRVGGKMTEYTVATDQKIINDYLKKVSVAKRQALIDMDRDNFGQRKRQMERLRSQGRD